MSIFRKKHDVAIAVGKDLHVYFVINSNTVEKSSVISPSGARFEGNKIVRITEEPKRNPAPGTYRVEVVTNGKTQSFTKAFKGPALKVKNVVPSWNRYEGVSAFYVLSEARYDVENQGDMPFFFAGKDFKLPTGYLNVPEFFVLPMEAKEIGGYARECDRVAMMEMEEYEEVVRRIGKELEKMGRARFGLATSAL